MDTETEEKLTGQQYQIDRLSDKVEAKMETMVAKNKATHAESESAIDRLSNAEAIGELRSDYEKAIGELRSDYKKAIGEFRTDMEKSISSNTAKLMTFTGITIAVLGVFVSVVSLIINLFV